MQARYYDPVIGRFYSNDPVNAATFLSQGNIQGFNRYAYANNNPYKFTDRKQWDGLLLNLNYCPFFGQYGDGELLVFKLGEAHGPDYSSRC